MNTGMRHYEQFVSNNIVVISLLPAVVEFVRQRCSL